MTTSDGAAAVFEGRRRRVAAVEATRQQQTLCGRLGRARNVIDDVLPDFAKNIPFGHRILRSWLSMLRNPPRYSYPDIPTMMYPIYSALF